LVVGRLSGDGDRVDRLLVDLRFRRESRGSIPPLLDDIDRFLTGLGLIVLRSRRGRRAGGEGDSPLNLRLRSALRLRDGDREEADIEEGERVVGRRRPDPRPLLGLSLGT